MCTYLRCAGIGLFAAAGAGKAIAFHLGPGAAVLMGVLNGIGGGMARDLLVWEVPVVFTAELYAVAALAGATVVVFGNAVFLTSVVGLCVSRCVSWRSGRAGDFPWLSTRIDRVAPARTADTRIVREQGPEGIGCLQPSEAPA